MTNNSITATIAVSGNPKHLFSCIESIQKLTQKIIIADIGADTLLIQKLKSNYHPTIITYSKPIPYVELIRNDLIQAVQTEYVLVIDPDELFPPSTIETINKLIPKIDYFVFPRKNVLFGKWIQHSRWWPDYQLRVFRKTSVVWPKVIHSQPIATKESKGHIFAQEEQTAIFHYNYETIHEYLIKSERYALAESIRFDNLSPSEVVSQASQTAVNEFMSRFFDAKGYKDGVQGLSLAHLQIYTSLLSAWLFFEKKEFPHISEDELKKLAVLYFTHGADEAWYWYQQTTKQSTFKRIQTKLIRKLIRILTKL